MNLIELQRALKQLRLGGVAAVLETRLHQAQAERMTWACVLPGQRWRRMRDSNSRGAAPNTLSKCAPQRSSQAVSVRDLG